MKTILGLVSSQRKLANGEILVKAVAAAAGEEYLLKLIRLPDLKLEPCRGCYTCLVPGKSCPIKDDLYFVANAIKEADGIILSAPCYALGPAAVTKLLGDRVIALTQMINDFWGKPCVIIATAGIKGWEGYTLSALTGAARFLGFRVKDAHMFVGALPGESIEQEETLVRVKEMGQALFGRGREARPGECPNCWSEIWKFPEPGRAVCPFCGQEASLTAENGSMRWEFGPPTSRFGREQLEEHFHDWLGGKVQEYLLRRKELAKVRAPYKGGDLWLWPESESDPNA
ncbi:NADPH-dependent FMN reductase [Peptococcaceae bacterium CEB3]|nr:NADPH-dependent FMN reductase [Peptococcaceae bacterium CEB3]